VASVTSTKNSIAVNAAWASFSAAVAQALTAAFLPALTRLYSPADFGLFTVVQSVAGVFGPFAGLRYELAIVLARSDRMAAALLLLQWASVSAFSVVVAVAVAVAFLVGNELGAIASLGPWIWSVPALVALTGVAQSATYFLIRKADFKQLGIMRIAQAAFASGLPLLGVFRAAGFGGLIGALLIASALSIVMPIRGVLAQFSKTLGRAARVGTVRRAAAAHFRFPLYSMPYGVVGTVRERGILLVFAALTTAEVAGLVAIAMRLSFFPAAFFASALGPVIYREAAVSVSNTAQFARLLRRIMILMTIGLTPLAVLLWLYGEGLFAVLLGESWREAGRFASVLAFPALTLVISGLFDRLFDVIKRQRVGFLIELTYSTISFSTVLVTLLNHVSALNALRLFAAITIIYHLVWIVLVYREWRLPMKDLLGALGAAAAAGLATLVAAAGVRWLF
jgi:O-antigen/teichoic acid export membrane protein